MDASTRALILQRARPYFEDGIIPASWDELPTTLRLRIQGVDPVLAEIWSGRMSADVELALLKGEISADPVTPKTEQQLREEKEAAILAVFAEMGPAKTSEQLDAELKQRLADQDQARMNSLVQSTGRWS